MLAIDPAFEHLNEARHDVGRPLRGFFTLEKSCVGIHCIEIEHTHTLKEGFRTIGFWRMLGAKKNILKVMLQEGECLSLQLEDRVHEEV